MKPKEIRRRFNKIYKKWQASREIDVRMGIIAAFMDYTMLRITSVTSLSAIPVLISVIKESEMFCNKPILMQEDPYINLGLTKNWFPSVLAQVLESQDIPTKEMFEHAGLDYEDAICPVVDEGSTTEMFMVNDVVHGQTSPIKLRLISMGRVRVGSVVTSKYGKSFKVIANKDGECELECETANVTMFRKEYDILNEWTINDKELVK